MTLLRSFTAGVLTLAVLHVFITCSDDGTQPNTPPAVDVEKIHEAAQRIEDAFRSADPEAVLEILTDEARERYAGTLEGLTDRMPDFADAIAARQLAGYGDFYAEYSYQAEGKTLTFALAAQDVDEWKLLRF